MYLTLCILVTDSGLTRQVGDGRLADVAPTRTSSAQCLFKRGSRENLLCTPALELHARTRLPWRVLPYPIANFKRDHVVFYNRPSLRYALGFGRSTL